MFKKAMQAITEALVLDIMSKLAGGKPIPEAEEKALEMTARAAVGSVLRERKDELLKVALTRAGLAPVEPVVPVASSEANS